MTMIPVVCFRCSDCNRLYEEKPNKCICERVVFIRGEQFGPFIVQGVDDKPEHVRAKCVLCDNLVTVRGDNMRKQMSCGCKPNHIETIELTQEIYTYRCRKCKKVTTKRLPIVSYCCEEDGDD